MSKVAKKKRIQRRRLQEQNRKKKSGYAVTLKHLQQTTIRPIGGDFVLRYRLFQDNSGKIYLLDRFNGHQVVQDVTGERIDHIATQIICKQWNKDFELYTEAVLEYVVEYMDEQQYWNYDYFSFLK